MCDLGVRLLHAFMTHSMNLRVHVACNYHRVGHMCIQGIRKHTDGVDIIFRAVHVAWALSTCFTIREWESACIYTYFFCDDTIAGTAVRGRASKFGGRCKNVCPEQYSAQTICPLNFESDELIKAYI